MDHRAAGARRAMTVLHMVENRSSLSLVGELPPKKQAMIALLLSPEIRSSRRGNATGPLIGARPGAAVQEPGHRSNGQGGPNERASWSHRSALLRT